MCLYTVILGNQRYLYLLKRSKGIVSKETNIKVKDPQIVHVMGKLSNLIMGGVLVVKHLDLGSLLLNMKINHTLILNTLIDLGDFINIMNHHTMESLGLYNLR